MLYGRRLFLFLKENGTLICDGANYHQNVCAVVVDRKLYTIGKDSDILEL